MLGFDGSDFVPLMIFAIPIVAIAGGITAGIVRMISQHRLIELAQRERIAAIERGVDPALLQRMPVPTDETGVSAMYLSPRLQSLRRAQGLMIGGLVCTATGLGLAVMLGMLTTGETNAWSVGMIPLAIGLSLLLAAVIVRRGAEDEPHVESQPSQPSQLSQPSQQQRMP
ncbi:MAG TPA: DUF6249 domain-containing protein [Candidatus Acidoferrales bacterium]|nr:DUF6249 domain-containing protein [Candidatus Acidoferrales bacterium]